MANHTQERWPSYRLSFGGLSTRYPHRRVSSDDRARESSFVSHLAR
jgi:hypothetical protein